MLLAIGGSLRIGEILGLQWDQVNVSPETIENGTSTVSVRQEQKRCEKEALEVLDTVGRSKVYFRFPERKAECSTVLVLKAPKTSSSVRTVYISRTVAEALLELKAEQERQKEALHGLYEDYDMVIAQSNGRPMERRLVEKQFREHITQQGLPQVVFHSLRHFSNSMKLALCGDINAKRQLETTQEEMRTAKQEAEKEFPKEQELREKAARLQELNSLLNMDERDDTVLDDNEVEADVPECSCVR